MKLSIIIPCYNSEKTLEEAVESCYRQGFEKDDFEVVMVDDGSNDSTRRIMADLKDKFANIKTVFHEKNKGGGQARNTAVENSIGEVIFCLDSDDILPDSTLNKMLSFLKEKDCDGVTVHKSVKFRGFDKNNIDRIDESKYPGEKIPLESLASKDEGFSPSGVNFMYTRKAFNKIGGYPTDHGFDTQGFGWRFLCHGLSLYTCPDTAYLHRIKANDSYYVREYKAGKLNHNWIKILKDNSFALSDKANNYIRKFNAEDFTEDIMEGLKNLGKVFKDTKDSSSSLSDHETLESDNQGDQDKANIERNSFKGYTIRIKKKLLKYSKNFLSDENRKKIRRIVNSPVLYFLKRSPTPLSDCYGFDRGTPLDRHYIEKFLEKNKGDIRGHCLELLNNDYTKKYGADKVSKRDILDIDEDNKNVTIIDDIRGLKKVSDNAYDCIILTQVLQFIDDLDSAISECHRILKDGGTLLATMPALSKIDNASGLNGDFWRFTSAGAKYLFKKKFSQDKMTIESFGNARSGIYFYAGVTLEETSAKMLDKKDLDFPTIIAVRAQK